VELPKIKVWENNEEQISSQSAFTLYKMTGGALSIICPLCQSTHLGSFMATKIVTLWVPKFNTMALAINLILIPENDDAVVMLQNIINKIVVLQTTPLVPICNMTKDQDAILEVTSNIIFIMLFPFSSAIYIKT